METQSYENREFESTSGCLIRIFWMMIGNVILLFCALAVLKNQSSLLGVADALYWATVGSLLAARFVDIRYLRGRTGEGQPASLAHWRRYAALVLVASTTLWLLVHAVAYFSAATSTG